ncbi:MAG TPA: phage holin family protein [Anaeromyxobacteraceae bacterium]
MTNEGDVARRAISGEAGHLRGLSLRELVLELARKGSLLARKEVALAKSEAREDIRSEIRMASGLGVAGVCALVTVQLLLVALVLALAEGKVMRGWLAALLVAAVVLAIGTVAGLLGWGKRVRAPLDATRRSVQENVRWVKERTA